MGSFFYLYSKIKMILPQKELDYMWPLISGLGQFNALMMIILSETWYDCYIFLVAVDISWNTRRGFC